MATAPIVTVGLIVRLEAKTGRELEVETLLRESLDLVDDEPGTTTWFALRLGPATFAIFDAFPDDAARNAHLSGRVASALTERASELLAQPPVTDRADVLAAKLPAAVPQR
jgi:quinol monooxygenase YgiN